MSKNCEPLPIVNRDALNQLSYAPFFSFEGCKNRCKYSLAKFFLCSTNLFLASYLLNFRMLKWMLLAVLCTGTKLLTAQIVVYGKAIDAATKKPVALATITNLNKGRSSVTDYNGRFAIVAEPGNLLVASFTGYDLDTLRIPDNRSDTLLVQMHFLENLLPEAIITAKSRYSQYQLDSMNRRMLHADVLDKTGIPTIGGPAEGSGFGITVNFGRRSKREKEERKFKTGFQLMEQEAFISSRFSPEKVAGITGLQPNKLMQFLNNYRPTYDWARKHPTDDDLLDYINSKMKDFRKRGYLN